MTVPAPILVLIGVDPRESHRANEALRIALGLVSGEHDVTVVLSGAGVHLLDEETDDLVDGDDIAKFRASLRSLAVPIHIEEGSRPADPRWNADGHPIVVVRPSDITGLMRRSHRTLIF